MLSWLIPAGTGVRGSERVAINFSPEGYVSTRYLVQEFTLTAALKPPLLAHNGPIVDPQICLKSLSHEVASLCHWMK